MATQFRLNFRPESYGIEYLVDGQALGYRGNNPKQVTIPRNSVHTIRVIDDSKVFKDLDLRISGSSKAYDYEGNKGPYNFLNSSSYSGNIVGEKEISFTPDDVVTETGSSVGYTFYGKMYSNQEYTNILAESIVLETATTETTTEVETEVIPYETKVIENDELDYGIENVQQEGSEGIREITYEITLTNGAETDRKLISDIVTKEPVKKIVEVGTKPVITTDTKVEDKVIPYETEIVENPNRFTTDSRTVTEGVDGLKRLTYEVTLTNGTVTERNLVSEETVKEVINEVIEQGTIPVQKGIDYKVIVKKDRTLENYDDYKQVTSTKEYTDYNELYKNELLTLKAEEGFLIDSIRVGNTTKSSNGFFGGLEETNWNNVNGVSNTKEYSVRWGDYIGINPTYRVDIEVTMMLDPNTLPEEPEEPVEPPVDPEEPEEPIDPPIDPEEPIEPPIEPEEPEYNVKLTQELTNVLSDYNKDTITNNVSITYIAENHYYLGNINIVQVYSTKQVPHVITNGNNNTAVTVDFSQYVYDDVLEIIVTAKASKRKSQIRYDYTNEYGEGTVEGVTVNFNRFASIGDDDIIIITADEGLDFKDGITLHVNYPEELVTIQKSYVNYSFYQDNSSYFNEDSTVIRIPVADVWEEEFYEFPPDYIEVRVKATQKRLGGGFVSNYARIYEMTESNLDKLSTVLWTPTLGSTGTAIYERITNIYSMPFKLPEALVSDDKEDIVRVGKDSSQYPKANYLLDNKYILPLGKIEIPLEYENVYDYKDTEVKLHAPYVVNPISIDPTYAIGETITLNMAIDLYNGNTTLNIHSTKINGELVERVNIPIKHDIPIVMSNSSILEGSVGGYVYNRVTTPFIEVVRNVPYENDSVFGKESNDFRTIGDLTGYIEIKDSQVKTNATTVEQTKIANELASGIYIKEPLPLKLNNLTK